MLPAQPGGEAIASPLGRAWANGDGSTPAREALPGLSVGYSHSGRGGSGPVWLMMVSLLLWTPRRRC